MAEPTTAPAVESGQAQAPATDPGQASPVSEPVAAPVTGQVPDKFQGQSADAILKSYQELEKHATRQAQELSEIKKALEKQEPLSDDELQAKQAEEFVTRIVEQKMQPLYQKQSMYEFGQEVSRAKQLYPDADDALIQAKLIEGQGKITPTEAVRLAHEHVQGWNKKAVERYVSELESKRTQGGEKAGQTFNLEESRTPKTMKEANAQAAKRFEAMGLTP